MHIQINTGHNIKIHNTLIDKVSGIIRNSLSRFSSHITRVNVHLRDENSKRMAGHDVMRCMIEAHLEGRHPIAVTHQAAGLEKAVKGTSDKLAGMIGTIVERMHNRERLEDAPEPDESDTEAEEQSFATPQ
ncbi:MAG: HPF/RaiA family ribosome-associated protein [Spirochaetes bacterium]|nr:HPF/RaiA family ribosome-associated protein [Spirochaetota bacterium]